MVAGRERMTVAQIERKLRPLGSHIDRIEYLDGLLARMERRRFNLNRKFGAGKPESKESWGMSLTRNTIKTSRFRILRKLSRSLETQDLRAELVRRPGSKANRAYMAVLKYYSMPKMQPEDYRTAGLLAQKYAAAFILVGPEMKWRSKAGHNLKLANWFFRKAGDTTNIALSDLAAKGSRQSE
ncbi:MAG: hypothetical protein V1787_06295 [Candidatus Micrarchaeota archaeon]